MFLRQSNNLLRLHGIVFLWGFTAVLGQLITKPALVLVWYRMVIAAICLFLFLLARKTAIYPGRKMAVNFVLTGCLVALHWYLFYNCIKISTISVALVCLSTTTLFTSVLEPLVSKAKLVWSDLTTGVLIATGVALIFHFEGRYLLGTLYGLAAAAVASLFTIINGRFAKTSDAVQISLYEMVGGALLISVFLFMYSSRSTLNLSLGRLDFFYLIILSTVCTALAYAVSVDVMKSLNAITVVLVTSLEPVYGILLSLLIFGHKEQMTSGFYVGGTIILLSVFSYPLVNRYRNA